ncbi:MAG: ABC transporter ATP-binding protein [Myxococcota bacterium]|nr:ABC transporter ATP-binding protein [Myxococcota bacterium]
MITLRNVSKKYTNSAEGEFALRDCSLEIAEGDLVAIVGTSGSGKTTLLNIIGGLDRDFTGEVILAGRQLEQLSDRAMARLRNQEMGFVFQHFNLLDHMTAAETVALPHFFGGKSESITSPRVRAVEALTQLGLGEKIDEHPNNLSGGQKQRVAIARALFFNPRLLLCDEPTGSLDTTTGRTIIETFQTLNQAGYTILIITHEDRVSRAARRIIRLEDGRIVSDERTDT